MKKITLQLLLVLSAVFLFTNCNQLFKPTGPRQGGGGGGGGTTGGGGAGNSGDGWSNGEKGGISTFDMATFKGRIMKDIVYGENTDWQGQMQTLKLDIYEPEKVKTGKKFPLILSIHGGGFLVGGKAGCLKTCAPLANDGFVTVANNYRLGWTRDRTKLCDGDSTELKKAIYRAAQDASASLRFLVAHADEYSIDTNWIFVIGNSAGGVTALNIAYLSQPIADMYLPGSSATMGGVLTGTNNLRNHYTIKGVGNMWGGIGSTLFITKDNAVPTIFFHGKLDRVVPYNIGPVYSCPLFFNQYGSLPIYTQLKSLGVSAVAHIDPNGGHGVYSYDFRVKNMSCFFKNVMIKKYQNAYMVGGEDDYCP